MGTLAIESCFCLILLLLVSEKMLTVGYVGIAENCCMLQYSVSVRCDAAMLSIGLGFIGQWRAQFGYRSLMQDLYDLV